MKTLLRNICMLIMSTLLLGCSSHKQIKEGSPLMGEWQNSQNNSQLITIYNDSISYYLDSEWKEVEDWVQKDDNTIQILDSNSPYKTIVYEKDTYRLLVKTEDAELEFCEVIYELDGPGSVWSVFYGEWVCDDMNLIIDPTYISLNDVEIHDFSVDTEVVLNEPLDLFLKFTYDYDNNCVIGHTQDREYIFNEAY